MRKNLRENIRKKLTSYLTMLIISILLFTFVVPNISYSTAYAATTTHALKSLNRDTVYLIKGESTKLKVKGSSKKVTWSTSDKNIAVVSRSGKVTAVNYGNAYIKAVVNNKTYKCKVVVVDPSLIYLDPAQNSVNVGDTGIDLNPSSYDYSDAAIKAMKLTYKVSGGEGLKVSSTGIVTATKRGDYKVTAYLRNVVVDTISIKAIPAFAGFEESEISMPTNSTACLKSRDVKFADGFIIDCNEYFAENPNADDLNIVSSNPEVATAKGSFTCFLDDRSNYYYGIYVETGKDGIATLSLTVSGVTKSIKVIVGRGVNVLDPVNAVKNNNFTGYDETETDTLTWVRNFIDTNHLDSDTLTDREKVTIVQNYLNSTYLTNLGDTTSAYYRRILFGGFGIKMGIVEYIQMFFVSSWNVLI